MTNCNRSHNIKEKYTGLLNTHDVNHECLVLIYIRWCKLGKLRGVEKLSFLVESVMFCFRFFFYVIALMELYTEKDTIAHFGLVVIWSIAAMVVPICFWIPHIFKRSMYFCFAELLLTGSLTIFYVMQMNDSYTYLFITSMLTIAFAS